MMADIPKKPPGYSILGNLVFPAAMWAICSDAFAWGRGHRYFGPEIYKQIILVGVLIFGAICFINTARKNPKQALGYVVTLVGSLVAAYSSFFFLTEDLGLLAVPVALASGIATFNLGAYVFSLDN